MWESVLTGALIVLCILSVLMTALRLPGTWLMLVAAVGYGWWSDWQRVGAVAVAVLGGLALIGEAAELLMSVATAKRAGASRRATWGGLIGGLLGAIFLSSMFSIPFPVLGTLIGAMIGALVGCFAGATIAELTGGKSLHHGAKVGVFAAIGFALGTAIKLAIAMGMAAIVICSILFSPPAEADAKVVSAAGAHIVVEDPADAAGTWNGPFIAHFEHLDHLTAFEQIGGGDAVLGVDQFLNPAVALL